MHISSLSQHYDLIDIFNVFLKYRWDVIWERGRANSFAFLLVDELAQSSQQL